MVTHMGVVLMVTHMVLMVAHTVTHIMVVTHTHKRAMGMDTVMDIAMDRSKGRTQGAYPRTPTCKVRVA